MAYILSKIFKVECLFTLLQGATSFDLLINYFKFSNLSCILFEAKYIKFSSLPQVQEKLSFRSVFYLRLNVDVRRMCGKIPQSPRLFCLIHLI